MSILLIEDHPEQGKHILGMLHEFSSDVLHVAVPLQAFTVTASKRFSLILVNLHLDDIGGLVVARVLRQGENNTNVPILTYSTDWDVKVQELLDSGCNDFLPYPFTSTVLHDKLRLWLEYGRKQNSGSRNAAAKAENGSEEKQG